MHSRVQAVLLGLLILALVVCGWLFATRGRGAAAVQSELDTARAAQAQLTTRAAALEKENAALRAQLADRGIEPAVAPHPSRASETGARLEAIRELTAAQAKLNAANSTIADLQNHIHDLETTRDNLTLENRKLSADVAGVREDFDSTRRVVQAMEAELKAKNERVTQVESNLRRTRDEYEALQKKAGLSGETANSLLEVNRRREALVTGLQRRYRDLNDQLRALSVRMDTQRDSPVMAAPDISRIQTAIQSTEDDLRQLLTLNTQAQNLTSKLGKK